MRVPLLLGAVFVIMANLPAYGRGSSAPGGEAAPGDRAEALPSGTGALFATPREQAPEPPTLILMGTGLLGVALLVSRKVASVRAHATAESAPSEPIE